MDECRTRPIRLAGRAALPLEVDFLGGRLTSDGGLAWIADADEALGLTAALAGVIPDWRRRRGQHDLPTLISQRVYQIACGYEDQDDADHLRTDPLLKYVCGRLPQSGRDLASQPTFSRLENAISARTCYRLAYALGDVYLRERDRGAPTSAIRPSPTRAIRSAAAASRAPTSWSWKPASKERAGIGRGRTSIRCSRCGP